MSIFLYDDEDGRSVFIPANDFDQAEKLADERNLKLIGRFLNFVDEATGEVEYLN
jgi:hypothetical protein